MILVHLFGWLGLVVQQLGRWASKPFRKRSLGDLTRQQFAILSAIQQANGRRWL